MDEEWERAREETSNVINQRGWLMTASAPVPVIVVASVAAAAAAGGGDDDVLQMQDESNSSGRQIHTCTRHAVGTTRPARDHSPTVQTLTSVLQITSEQRN